MDSKRKQRSLTIYGKKDDATEDAKEICNKKESVATNIYNSIVLKYNNLLLKYNILLQRSNQLRHYAGTKEGKIKLSVIGGSAILGVALAIESKSTIRLYKRCIPLATVGAAASVCYPSDAIRIGSSTIDTSKNAFYSTVETSKNVYNFTTTKVSKIYSSVNSLYSSVADFSKSVRNKPVVSTF